jgi:crossover junction endodeoxyribonuclease RuvC
MKVLGIDPGYGRLGVAVIKREGTKSAVLHSNCIETDRDLPLAKRLLIIGDAVEALLLHHRPAAVAVEGLFFNRNVKTALAVAEARGVVLFLAARHKTAVFELSPQAVKVAITGYGQSDKAAVTRMVKRLVANVPARARDDEYDAIAIGVAGLSCQGEAARRTLLSNGKVRCQP